MVGVVALCAVDRGFEPQSGQTKDYKIGIILLLLHSSSNKEKEQSWLSRNQDNVSKRCSMSTRGLLFP